MAKKKRDDFTSAIVKALRDRVNNLCSNPDCGNLTVEPQKTDKSKINITGIAAHICAAAIRGPRYDESMSPEERKSIDNGIWLCNHCARKIDTEPKAYSVELLKFWKKKAELKVLVNSNRPLYTASELEKEAQSRVLQSHLTGQNFGTVANSSLTDISKIIREELKILDPRINIQCNIINNETHYIINAAENSEEPVKFTFKLGNSDEFQEKYNRLIEHGESFKTSLDGFISNSDALNAIFPAEIKEGILIIKPVNNLIGVIEITDEKGNILLELQDNFILGKKSFSIYASKFNNFLTIFFKNVNFRDDVNQEDKSDINFHFPIWDGLDIRSLPYFEQIKRLVEKIENSKKLFLRIFINGNEVYSATSNRIPQQISQISNLLKYTDSCRKIVQRLDAAIPFRKDITFTSEEHKKLFEASEMLNSIIEEKKFKGSMVLEPKSKKEIEKLFQENNFELLMYQSLQINDMNIFGQLVNFDLYFKHIFKYPQINLIKQFPDRSSYKYEIKQKNANSLYIRESSLTPFDQPENQITIK